MKELIEEQIRTYDRKIKYLDTLLDNSETNTAKLRITAKKTTLLNVIQDLKIILELGNEQE